MSSLRNYGIFLVAVSFIIAMAGFVMAHDSGNAAEIEGPVTTAPEFPSIFLPLTLIIGILGAIVMIKITAGEQ